MGQVLHPAAVLPVWAQFVVLGSIVNVMFALGLRLAFNRA